MTIVPMSGSGPRVTAGTSTARRGRSAETTAPVQRPTHQHGARGGQRTRHGKPLREDRAAHRSMSNHHYIAPVIPRWTNSQ